MWQEELAGIVNSRLGMLDLFPGHGKEDSVALPLELSVSKDPERITQWARETGLIRQGECIAISDS